MPTAQHNLPPGPGGPAFVNFLRWVRDPVRVSRECGARYGETFSIPMPSMGDVVFVSSPQDIKQVFTGDPDVLHAGEGNFILEALVGKNSILLLDGPAHL